MLPVQVFVGSHERFARCEPVIEYSIKKHCPNANVTILRPSSVHAKDTGCTGFTNIRYAIPNLHDGFAIYLDVDMLVLSDISELLQYKEAGRFVRLLDGATEVLVIDCSVKVPAIAELHLYKKWELENRIKFSNKIPLNWNVEDNYNENAKLIHFTDLKCQPWFYDHPCKEAVAIWEQYEKDSKSV